MEQPPLRIAMWSGPRTISSAMMRAWGNRSDTVVCDEPLYAHYLRETRLPHPGAQEVVQHHEADWAGVSIDDALAPAVAWAEEHAPDALAKAYPEGRMIYSEETGRHWVALLRRWSEEVEEP